MLMLAKNFERLNDLTWPEIASLHLIEHRLSEQTVPRRGRSLSRQEVRALAWAWWTRRRQRVEGIAP